MKLKIKTYNITKFNVGDIVLLDGFVDIPCNIEDIANEYNYKELSDYIINKNYLLVKNYYFDADEYMKHYLIWSKKYNVYLCHSLLYSKGRSFPYFFAPEYQLLLKT